MFLEQVVRLTFLDIGVLALGELYVLISCFGSQVYGRLRKFAQASINKAYEPPEFKFADRYAYMLKIAAMVLVFGPAAPLLYFVGGATLLFSWCMQNLMLAKVYKRPRPLDHQAAERSRACLMLLLLLHVCSSTAFYTRQAYVAHHVELIKVPQLACSAS